MVYRIKSNNFYSNHLVLCSRYIIDDNLFTISNRQSGCPLISALMTIDNPPGTEDCPQIICRSRIDDEMIAMETAIYLPKAYLYICRYIVHVALILILLLYLSSVCCKHHTLREIERILIYKMAWNIYSNTDYYCRLMKYTMLHNNSSLANLISFLKISHWIDFREISVVILCI